MLATRKTGGSQVEGQGLHYRGWPAQCYEWGRTQAIFAGTSFFAEDTDDDDCFTYNLRR